MPEKPKRNPKSKPANPDHLPPYTEEGEKAVLGALLSDPVKGMPLAISHFPWRVSTFYDPRHQTIFETMLDMYEKREKIDIVTVKDRLKIAGLVDAIGGLTYLAQMMDFVPKLEHLESYLQMVHDKAILRRVVQVFTDAVVRIYDFEGAVEELMDGVERDVLDIRRSEIIRKSTPMRSLITQSLGTIEDYRARGGAAMDGLGTGYSDLDKLTTGFHPGDMIVIAARPSVGKTSLALNIADHIAVNLKQGVGIFSFEMSSQQLSMRMLCSRARVNIRSVRDGFLAERDMPRLTLAAQQLSDAPIYIDDDSDKSLFRFRAAARRMVHEQNIKFLVADYLQLMNNAIARPENRQREIASISGGIKSLGQELGIPILVLSQLNRELDKENRRPRMSDLRESGAIEQDADILGLMYKPKKDDDDEPDSEAQAISLLIAKQRNGDAGVDVRLTFLKKFTRFESAAKIHDEDVPTQGDMPL